MGIRSQIQYLVESASYYGLDHSGQDARLNLKILPSLVTRWGEKIAFTGQSDKLSANRCTQKRRIGARTYHIGDSRCVDNGVYYQVSGCY